MDVNTVTINKPGQIIDATNTFVIPIFLIHTLRQMGALKYKKKFLMDGNAERTWSEEVTEEVLLKYPPGSIYNNDFLRDNDTIPYLATFDTKTRTTTVYYVLFAKAPGLRVGYNNLDLRLRIRDDEYVLADVSEISIDLINMKPSWKCKTFDSVDFLKTMRSKVLSRTPYTFSSPTVFAATKLVF